MGQLREACANAGFAHVRTILATGNLVFSASQTQTVVKHKLDAIVRSHGLDNAVFLRRPGELEAVLAQAPFPDAIAARPNHTLVLFLEQEADTDRATELEAGWRPERIKAIGRDVYIDYVDGVGRSKLTTAVLEQRLGQPGTARNWNTIEKLCAAART
ncbi:DUF1697 domain-containing protein [Consotaella aegiceratis]|uniref:DUF1697 domain-containing protein n=1 Tax=Consotaella aegiceratis TaxID=3097961 RepID=UPI002F3F1699